MSSLFEPAPAPKTELGRYRVLSSTAGIKVSPLQLGAMSIGDAWKKEMGSMDKQSAFKLLDAFEDAGGNFIDTANNYQDQQSEEWIGEWMHKKQNRDFLVLATKFTTNYVVAQHGKNKSVNHMGNNKKSLHMSLRDSLKKLKTDYIDILYVHWWDWSVSIEEMMDSLDAVVKSGKVLYLGISDSPAYIVSAANEYAKARGKTQFSIYQGRWNVMLRDLEREIIPMTQLYGMAIAPWDVLGSGKFQSKKALEERKKNNEGLRSLLGDGQQTAEQAKISEALEKVANEHGHESPTVIALAYVMAKAPRVFPIVGGRKVEHLQQNIKALSVKLTTKQIEELENVFSFDHGFPTSFIGADPHVTGKPSPLISGTATVDYLPATRPLQHE